MVKTRKSSESNPVELRLIKNNVKSPINVSTFKNSIRSPISLRTRYINRRFSERVGKSFFNCNSQLNRHSLRTRSNLPSKDYAELTCRSSENVLRSENHLKESEMDGGEEADTEEQDDADSEHDDFHLEKRRRSTRQRKFRYSTFDQKVIDRNLSYLNDGDSFDAYRCDKEIKQHKRHLSKESSPANSSNMDMYSRVKRKRRSTRLFDTSLTDNRIIDEPSDDDQIADECHSEESESEVIDQPRGYHLREHRARVSLYEAPANIPRPRKFDNPFSTNSSSRIKRHKVSNKDYCSPIKQSHLRRKKTLHKGSSTSSSSSSDEEKFQRRKAKSMNKSRNRCLPMNFQPDDLSSGILRERTKVGSSLADVDPMTLDTSIKFDSIGGLEKHVRSLKEMIVFPLLYPEIFEKFGAAPPRGVLFHGPPGTGKTLMARALANECSSESTKVAFFMRKGADCLSKWVGESERQLRLLFDQAYIMRPSIIFFDEIDGIAPVRSSRQDQIHSSIVSTLLALMDGLDNRGEVVVIGATNRIDSIDPALRRPGRFDREFFFPLPSLPARKQILSIHTKNWSPKLTDNFLEELAKKCVGYCGADLRSLCTETVLQALRRRYPQIYSSSEKLKIDVNSIILCPSDFVLAMQNITPTAHRPVASHGSPLTPVLLPLLKSSLDEVIERLNQIFPPSSTISGLSESHNLLLSTEDENEGSIFESTQKLNQHSKNKNTATSFLSFKTFSHQAPLLHRPRLVVCGHSSQCPTTYLGPAVLHYLEGIPVHLLDFTTLYGTNASTPEEICSKVFREVKHSQPCILYIPHIDTWWEAIPPSLQNMFLMMLEDVGSSSPVLFFATSDQPFHNLQPLLRLIFTHKLSVFSMTDPTQAQREEFFKELLLTHTKKLALQSISDSKPLEVLSKAPPVESRKLTEAELVKVRLQEEQTMRELRLFLRDVLSRLGRDRKFSVFTKPVDSEEVPDYYDVIENPMDLSTVMSKIDLQKYQTCDDFLSDITLICSNALEYNPDTELQSRVIRHRACALRDLANAIITTELDPDFDKMCQEVKKSRQNRGDSPIKSVPSFYHTKPLDANNCVKNLVNSANRIQTSSCNATTNSPALSTNCSTPVVRKIFKKVPIKSARVKHRSPWVRSAKKRYRIVAVNVDEFGNEINSENESPKNMSKSLSPVSNKPKEHTSDQITIAESVVDFSKPQQTKSAQDLTENNLAEVSCDTHRHSSQLHVLTDFADNIVNDQTSSSTLLVSPKSPISNSSLSPRVTLGRASCSPSIHKVVNTSISHSSPKSNFTANSPKITDLNGFISDSEHQLVNLATKTFNRENKSTDILKASVDNSCLKTSETKSQRITRSQTDFSQTHQKQLVLDKNLVKCDTATLQRLLKMLIAVTDGFHVLELEFIYSQISLLIFKYRKTFDKSQLLQDVENLILNIGS